MTRATPTDVPYAGLRRLGEVPSTRAYARELWQRREFGHELALGEVRSQNMDTVLGNLWHLLNPLLLIAVYFLIFGVLLDTSRGVENTFTFIAIGVFVFRYTQGAVISASNSIVTNQGLLSSIRFPRAILPLSGLLEQTIVFGSAVAVMVALALVTGEGVSPAWILLLVVFALQLVFTAGVGLVVARFTTKFRDLPNLLRFGFRLLFYASGALYPVTRFVDEGSYRLLFDLNPMYCFIELWRAPLMREIPMQGGLWVSAGIWSVVVLVGGFTFFRRGEPRYGNA